MKIGNCSFFRGWRSWSDRRWSNTPKWLLGVDLWAFDSLGWGTAHCGWLLNPRVLTVGVSWDIVSENWIGAQNELFIRVHPLPMLTLYVTFLIPEKWIAKRIGTSKTVAGYFGH